ncbi:hypothetical protein CLF_113231 [Clonorchis sinensis]|uniref:Uncharacterized protein n=1 Tax=Clonorchis sinensis TaxID=79923 RepID=G7YMT9_CLOSI|nr:hypothetical protein CLF_113231 [Clonorchis sinensis]
MDGCSRQTDCLISQGLLKRLRQFVDKHFNSLCYLRSRPSFVLVWTPESPAISVANWVYEGLSCALWSGLRLWLLGSRATTVSTIEEATFDGVELEIGSFTFSVIVRFSQHSPMSSATKSENLTVTKFSTNISVATLRAPVQGHHRDIKLTICELLSIFGTELVNRFKYAGNDVGCSYLQITTNVQEPCVVQCPGEESHQERNRPPLLNQKVQSTSSAIIEILDTELKLLSKALEGANTKKAATRMKVDKEFSPLNGHLALSAPGPLAARRPDAALKTATASLVDRGKILVRAVSIQNAYPTIRRPSEDRHLGAQKLDQSSSWGEIRKKASTWRQFSRPQTYSHTECSNSRCVPESTPRQPTAIPDSSFHSTTADPSSSKGSDALEEASLTWTKRPEQPSLLSVTDDKGAAVNSTPKSQLPSWTGSDERRQAAKPTDKSTTCVDLDIGECCENRTITENVKLPISSSTPSKVASSIVDTVVARDPNSQSLKPDHSAQESPSYTQLATLIAGDSGVHTSTNEGRL